jgi:glutathione S-transferase
MAGSPSFETALIQAGMNQGTAAQLLQAVQQAAQAQILSPSLPILDVINLADFLADVTKRFVRFLPGADMVGGETDIATVTRHERFKWSKRLYGVLDRRLEGRDFVATDGEPSIADFAILGWAWRHERHQVDLAGLPNVKRWYEAMMARPATKRGFEVSLG